MSFKDDDPWCIHHVAQAWPGASGGDTSPCTSLVSPLWVHILPGHTGILPGSGISTFGVCTPSHSYEHGCLVSTGWDSL